MASQTRSKSDNPARTRPTSTRDRTRANSVVGGSIIAAMVLITQVILMSSVKITAFSPSETLSCWSASRLRNSPSTLFSRSRTIISSESGGTRSLALRSFASKGNKINRKGILLRARVQGGDDNDIDNDDDEWGTTDAKSSSAGNDNIETLRKERELASLRSEISSKGSTGSRNPNSYPSSSSSSSSGSGGTEVERDLFIPIFAVVSLLGLFGAYGYEMLRLYSRGELYLPWDS